MKTDLPSAFYKSIFDNTLDGMAYCQMLFDAQGHPIDFIYLKVNANFGKLTGLERAIGKKVTELIPGISASNSELFEIYGRVSLTQKPERFETYVKPLSRWFLVSVYSPRKKFFVAVFQNITDQKEIEKNFEDSKIAARNVLEDLNSEKTRAESLANDLEKFKLALDNASDMVIITDAKGTVVYANAAVEKIGGYKPEEVLGKKSSLLWESPLSTDSYQNMRHIIQEDKRAFIGGIQSRRKNGELYTAAVNITPVLDDKKKILFFVGIGRDITKEMEIDKTKDEFISLASHQLRTPLTVVRWYTKMLLGGGAGTLSEKQNDYFKEIYAASLQMNDIIKSFLHILRLETGKITNNPVPTDVKGIVTSILQESKFDIEKKHLHIIEQYADSLPLPKVDPDLTRVIVQNIISNAIKYAFESKEITIALASAAQGSAVSGKTVVQDSLIASVHDNGISIAPADHDKIFGKFFRVDDAKRVDSSGNGLGLYMAKKMVDIVGGTIWFDSEEGKGTTFYLLLPLDVQKMV